MQKDMIRRVILGLSRMAVGGSTLDGCDTGEVLSVCRASGAPFEQFCSYLLPFVLQHNQDMVYDLLQELCSSYDWPTGKGFAKIVLPAVYWASPDNTVEFLHHLWNGNPEQRKACAESLRAVLYRDFQMARDLLYRCLDSDRETIRREAPRPLPCLSEIDLHEAELLKAEVIEHPDLLPELEILAPGIPDRFLYRQGAPIEVTPMFGVTEHQPNRICYLRSLACGLPGLAIANEEAALSRVAALSGFSHAFIRAFGVVHLSLFAAKRDSRIESATANALHSDLADDRLMGLVPAFLMAAQHRDRWSAEIRALVRDPSQSVAFVAAAVKEAIQDLSGPQ